MNADDVYKYGHLWVLNHLEGLAEEDWNTGGVCGVWSVKEIIVHLCSFEYLLAEAYDMVLGNAPGPYLKMFMEEGNQVFNDKQVESRSDKSVNEILEEYKSANKIGLENLANISMDIRRTAGKIPWYGNEYDLEDLVTYMYYGHKREHCSQIAIFRDSLDPNWQSGG